jgi:hypothetical protein
MNAGLVIILIVGIYVLRSKPVRSDQYDAPIVENSSKLGSPEQKGVSP